METSRRAWPALLLLAGCPERPLYLPDEIPDLAQPDLAQPDLARPLQPPRPIAPLTTSTVTTRRPTLRWVGSATAVELCRDRACSMRLGTATVDASGTRARPDFDLPTGSVFWRVHSRMSSATWQFWVGAGSTAVDSSFGTTLDLDGDGHADLAVGESGGGEPGAVHIYRGTANGISSTPTMTLPVDDRASFPETLIYSASDVASAGDLDGDGFGDLVVSSTSIHQGGEPQRGVAHIYLGGPDGAQPSRVLTLKAPAPDERFGSSVRSAGDIDGDGYGDLLVLAGEVTPPPIYVFLGGPDGVRADRVRRVMGPAEPVGTTSGCDFNGDGYSDLLFGEHTADMGTNNYAGRALAYFGGPGGLGAPTSIPAPKDAKGWQFGYTAAANDFNGDGLCDAALTQVDGLLYVFFGRPDGISTVPDHSLDLGRPTYPYLANAGDVDGDGATDLLAYVKSGLVRLVFGGRFTMNDLTSTDWAFGFTLAGTGDLDGDGAGDFTLGAPQPTGGAVYLFTRARGDDPLVLKGPPDGGTRFGDSLAGLR